MSAAMFPLVLLVAMATSMCLLCDGSAAPLADQQPNDSLSRLSTNEVVDSITLNQLAILQMMSTQQDGCRHWDDLIQKLTVIERDLENLTVIERDLEKLTVIERDLEALKENQNDIQLKLNKMRPDEGKVFEHDNKRYYLYTASEMTWSEARLWCQTNRHGDLAQPTGDIDRFMRDAVARDPGGTIGLYNHMGLWIGASDLEQEGTWMWVSGKQLSDNFPWADGQPNNAYLGQDCMDIRYRKQENLVITDYSCDSPQHFICEEYN